MKITLLLAGYITPYLQLSLNTVIKVLEELEVTICKVDLQRLPYFSGQRNKEMDAIMQAIEESQGVIAISAVPMLSMHGAMQSFFDTATLYEAKQFDKPMLAITYSDWLGESEAAALMLKSWNVLGGIEGNKLCINKSTEQEAILSRVEREVEDFYRLIKQARRNVGSSERKFFHLVKSGYDFSNMPETTTKAPEIKTQMVYSEEKEKPVQIKSFVELLRAEGKEAKPMNVSEMSTRPKETSNQVEPRINITTKEQTIKEIANLIKKETSEDGFTSMQVSGIYTKPNLNSQHVGKRIAQLPHCFVAQHDKQLHLTLKYHITDTNEEGALIIQNGDCTYVEKLDEVPSVELILNEEVFINIQNKKMTYQKAFMLGKLKVKGNFAILPKLDQIFKVG